MPADNHLLPGRGGRIAAVERQTADAVRRLLRVHLPDRVGGEVALLGEGLDNVAYAAGDLVVRVAKEPDPVRRAALVRREARVLAVAGRVPAPYRPAVEAFLAAEPPPDTAARVFSHDDLGVEHVLVDPATGTVTGVIDWADAGLVDPATDCGRVLRDLGPAALAWLFPMTDEFRPVRASTSRRSGGREERRDE
jgi:aminoglycoside phosphotransferase (APT) family kinase protein